VGAYTPALQLGDVDGGTLNSGVNVELVPVVELSQNRLKVVECQLEVPEQCSSPFRLNLNTG